MKCVKETLVVVFLLWTFLAGAGLPTEGQLRKDGAFLFPQVRASILSDTKELRVSAWNSDGLLYVQAVLWSDNSDAIGTDDEGRQNGDWSILSLDLDADQKVTANVDRSYVLNQKLSEAGLSYSLMLGRHSHTTNRSDSSGVGAVCYVNLQGGRKVRVDSYVLPLKELGRRSCETVRVCYQGWSATPDFKVSTACDTNSSPDDSCSHIPVTGYQEVALSRGEGPTLQDIESSWEKDSPTYSRTKPVLDSNEDWFTCSTIDVGRGFRRTELPGNSAGAIRAELGAPDFLTLIAAKAGLSRAQIAKITLKRAEEYDWFELKQNGTRPEIFNTLYEAVRNYVQGRERGYSAELLLSSFRRGSEQDTPADPDLRFLLQAHPELPAGAVRRLSEEFSAADGGGSNRWVRYVVADKEIAAIYVLSFGASGKLKHCDWGSDVDPKEIDQKYEAVFKDVEREIEAKMKTDGTAGQFGSCHHYWRLKKEALKARGIDWRSPSELNPNTNYD